MKKVKAVFRKSKVVFVLFLFFISIHLVLECTITYAEEGSLRVVASKKKRKEENKKKNSKKKIKKKTKKKKKKNRYKNKKEIINKQKVSNKETEEDFFVRFEEIVEEMPGTDLFYPISDGKERVREQENVNKKKKKTLSKKERVQKILKKLQALEKKRWEEMRKKREKADKLERERKKKEKEDWKKKVELEKKKLEEERIARENEKSVEDLSFYLPQPTVQPSKLYTLFSDRTDEKGRLVFNKEEVILPSAALIGYKTTGENTGREISISWEGSDLERVKKGIAGIYTLTVQAQEEVTLGSKTLKAFNFVLQIEIQ